MDMRNKMIILMKIYVEYVWKDIKLFVKTCNKRYATNFIIIKQFVNKIVNLIMMMMIVGLIKFFFGYFNFVFFQVN